MSEKKDSQEEYEQEEYSFIKEKIKERPTNKRKLFWRIGSTALLAVLFGVVAVITMYTVQPGLQSFFEEETASDPVQLPVQDDESDEEGSEDEAEEQDRDDEQEDEDDFLNDYERMFSELYAVAQKASKSMVTVTGVRSGTDWYNNTYEDPDPTEVSGLILQQTGREILILTELAAVQSASDIQITFHNGYVAEAELKGADGNTGIAVVSVPAENADYNSVGDIQEAELGNSNTVQRGEVVIAIGSPLGYNDAISYGIITSKGNEVSTVDANYKVLTTDINGSSNGNGVLINLKGQVIGVIAQQYNSDEYTITCLGLNDILEEIEMLCNGYEIPQIGIKVATVTDSIAKQYEELQKGVCVMEIVEDSPAWEAGLNNRDIITGFNGESISTTEDYRSCLLGCEHGDSVQLTVMREEQEMQFDIVLGSK